MLTERDLKELLDYHAQSPVLSVYLSTEPSAGSVDTHKLRLRTMLKDMDLTEDVERVLRYFDHDFDWSGRSVVVFSCVPEDYFRAYPIAVPARSRVRVGDRPYVKPLADLLDSFGGYGVALIDKQGARLFYFHLGELREQEGVIGEEVRHTKRGGGSQAPGRRGGVAGKTNYVEEVTERNIKDSADFAAHFFSENNVRRVLIGGSEENLKPFKSSLPKTWQSLVVGTFPMSMNATHLEVMEKAMEVGIEAENRRKAKVIETVITGAAKGKGGAVRLEDTLRALHDGRVQTLVIQDGLRVQGNKCQGCGFVTTETNETCPYCGNNFDPIPDVVELAVRSVMRSGGEVEVVHLGNSLKEYEGIGALLRY